MIESLQVATEPSSLLAILIGAVLGTAVGAMPGFTATMGVALLLPFTFSLEPVTALAMLGSLYVAASFADSIPAIVVNTPGSPGAIMTAMDGYTMARRGEGQKAIIASAISALFGTIVGGIVFLLLAAPLAAIALRFGPPEFLWIGIFAITLIGSIAGDSILKGIAGGVLGLAIATVGLAASGAVSRYTFGIPELRGGVDIVPAVIGVFALPQVLAMVASRREVREVGTVRRQRGVMLSTFKELFRKPANLIRSTIIGTGIGIMPGAGGAVASVVSYGEAKRWDETRDQFGKGAIGGVVASESAGNAAAAGSLIPTMGLGIPGSPAAAVILGALLLQGIQPGPQLFETQPVLVYAFALTVIISGLVMFVIGASMSRVAVKLTDIPTPILAPIILFLSVIGTFAYRNNIVDVFIMLFLGVGAHLISKVGFHPGPIGLGIVMAPIIEPALVESLAIAQASSYVEVFFTRPISLGLIALIFISVTWTLYSVRKEAKKALVTREQEMDDVRAGS